MKVRVIIFSSAESLDLAKLIQQNLHYGKYLVQVWTDSFFKLSSSCISNFEEINFIYDFAVIICSDDDRIRKRGKKGSEIRDNILLELGMCISAFSLDRVIIVENANISLPTDLNGITSIPYSLNDSDNINMVAGMICSKIDGYALKKIQHVDYEKLSWNAYLHTVKTLVNQLTTSDGLGGYTFDIIVGINRGLTAADLISREFGHNMPVLALLSDRRSRTSKFDHTDLLVNNNYIIETLNDRRIKNILLVDNFTRDGRTIFQAKQFLIKKCPNKIIKTAVIYVNERLRKKQLNIDYIGTYINLDKKRLTLE